MFVRVPTSEGKQHAQGHRGQAAGPSGQEAAFPLKTDPVRG